MQNNEDTPHRILGSILLIIGWIITIVLLGFLYQKSIYSTEDAQYEVNAEQIKITLYRQRNGHFSIPVTINGRKIPFLIDTGATLTAISEKMAKKSGLNFDRPTEAFTAGGRVDAHLTIIDEFYLGSMMLPDVSAIVLPKMNAPGLLGMNVLKKFTILQQGNTLELTYPSDNR